MSPVPAKHPWSLKPGLIATLNRVFPRQELLHVSDKAHFLLPSGFTIPRERRMLTEQVSGQGCWLLIFSKGRKTGAAEELTQPWGRECVHGNWLGSQRRRKGYAGWTRLSLSNSVQIKGTGADVLSPGLPVSISVSPVSPNTTSPWVLQASKRQKRKPAN